MIIKSIAEILQRLHQFHHLQCLPRLRLVVICHCVCLVCCFEVVEVDDLIFKHFINEQCEYFLEVDHVAADNAARQPTYKCTVLATFPSLLQGLLQLLLMSKSADFQVQQVYLLHSVLIKLKHCLCLVIMIIVSLWWLVEIHFLNVILVE